MNACSRRVFSVIGILGVSSVAAQDPSPRLKQPIFRQIAKPQGLAGEQARALLRDGDGLLWIGTEKALNRFDMYACVSVGVAEEDQPKDGKLEVTSLELLEGGLWVGTRHGLYLLDRDRGLLVPARSLLQGAAGALDLPVLCLARDPRGRLWIGCRGALACMDPAARSLRTIATPPSLLPDRAHTKELAFVSLLPEGESLWAGTENHGLYSLDLEDPRLSRHALRLPGGQEAFMVTCLQRRGPERLWVGTRDAGLLEYDPRQRAARAPGVAAWRGLRRQPVVTSICEDSLGKTWLGTSENGVFVLPEGQFRALPDSYTGLPDDRIRVLYKDPSDTLWIGTNAGACFVDDLMGPFRSHRPETPPARADLVRSIWTDPDGRVWIATHRMGLQTLDPETGSYRPYVSDSGKRPAIEMVRAIYRDRAGVLWVGGNGLFRMEGDTFARIELPEPERVAAPVLRNPKLGTYVKSLHEDRRGRLWVNLHFRLCVLSADRSRWRSLPLEKPVANLVEDEQGRIWAASTGAGILEIDPETEALRYHRPNSKTGDGPVSDKLFYLARGEAGKLWFTYDGGLGSYDPETGKGKSFPIPRSEHGVVHGILRDGSNRLWLNTEKSLIRFDPETKHSRVFDRFDLQGLGRFLAYSIHRAHDGELFFGRELGITRVRPDVSYAKSPDPELRLSTVRLRDRVLWPGSPELAASQLTLGHTRSPISIAVSDMDVFHGESRKFGFRLAGFDPAWSESETPSVTYAELPPGEYRLELRTSSEQGIWTEPRQLLALRVLPPFWDRSWFRWSALFALLFAGGFLFQRRVRSAARKERELDKVVGERTRELQSKAEELEGVQQFVASINAPMKLQDLLDRVLDGVLGLLGIARGRMLVLERGSGLFRFRAAVGWDERRLAERRLCPEEALRTYVHAAVDLERGILVTFDDGLASALPPPAKRVDTYVLPIESRGEMEAFLLLDHEATDEKPDRDQLLALESLRDPITWAFHKTRLLEELTELNEKRNEIMGMAAHDLKNPLHRLTLTASILIEDLESGRCDAESSGEELESILRSAQQMSDLLD
ncbi:MAG: two-component regulator propeller domain-containing protein, partial [Planctomycetota bacterium]